MKKLLLTTLFAICTFVSAVMAETVAYRLCVFLNNTGSEPCAYQCDVTFPVGVTMVEGSEKLNVLTGTGYGPAKLARTKDAADSFVIAANPALETNKCRLVGYTTQNTAFAGNSGMIASFQINVDKSIIKNVKTGMPAFIVDNVEIVNANSEVIEDASIKILLAGDTNGDGTIRSGDLTVFKSAFRGKTQAPYADVNGDGSLKSGDVTVFKSLFKNY